MGPEPSCQHSRRRTTRRNRLIAGVPGLEPRMAEPESAVLPITPYPTGNPEPLVRGVYSAATGPRGPTCRLPKIPPRDFTPPKSRAGERYLTAPACGRGPAVPATRRAAG